MKALTLWQPWASFLLVRDPRLKALETRPWRTSYRGPLAIHAAARTPAGVLADVWADPTISALRRTCLPPSLPLGCVIGIVDLVDCIPTEEIEFLNATEAALGDFSDGRWAWVTVNPRTLPVPIEYRGRQRLWEIPDGATCGVADPSAWTEGA